MIKLYSYFRSSCSYRVRIALNLKGIDYKIEPVHLVKDGGEQFSSNFMELNPSSKVPVLVHDDKALFQSVAIIEYLEETFPQKPLYPQDSFDKAQTRLLCEIINSDIQPLQNLAILKKLVKEFSSTDEQKIKWIQDIISLGFASYEKVLAQTAGQFSCGDQPTAADCFLIPQVYNADRFKVDMSSFPLIKRISDFSKSIEAFSNAHPDNQPDAPKP